jgi:hypothetical protein
MTQLYTWFCEYQSSSGCTCDGVTAAGVTADLLAVAAAAAAAAAALLVLLLLLMLLDRRSSGADTAVVTATFETAGFVTAGSSAFS